MRGGGGRAAAPIPTPTFSSATGAETPAWTSGHAPDDTVIVPVCARRNPTTVRVSVWPDPERYIITPLTDYEVAWEDEDAPRAELIIRPREHDRVYTREEIEQMYPPDAPAEQAAPPGEPR